MALQDVMSSTTNREYRTWCRDRRDQWGSPDRSDYYLMQIALEVREVLAQKKSGNCNKMLLKFGDGNKKAVSLDAAAQSSKARWFGMTGFKNGD